MIYSIHKLVNIKGSIKSKTVARAVSLAKQNLVTLFLFPKLLQLISLKFGFLSFKISYHSYSFTVFRVFKTLRALNRIRTILVIYETLLQQKYVGKRECCFVVSKEQGNQSELHQMIKQLLYQILIISKMENTDKALLLYIFGLIGYIILTTALVPSYAYGACSYANQIPSDAVVSLSLNSWMLGNFISGLPLYLIILSVAQIKGFKDCIIFVFTILGTLYTIFQNIWSIIGLLIFTDYYRTNCAYAGSFNTYTEATVYYGIVLFPVATVIAIIAGVIKYNRGSQESGTASQPIIESQLASNPTS